MDRSGLIVVIPAFCEAKTIGAVVAGVRPIAPVIVVDDASSDETSNAAAEAGADVVRNKTNLGYENTLNAGFSAAAKYRPQAIVTMDADGEHGPEHVSTFARLLIGENTPLVLGRRPRTQRMAEAAMGSFIKFRYGVSDIFCGMKGYQTDLWRQHGCFDSRSAVGTELALAAIRGGVPFREVPINGSPRPDTPRFANRFRANFLIARAIVRSLSAPSLTAPP